MKKLFFLFAFLFAFVAMEAKVVPIDNDVGPPITMELNATVNVAITQNVDFLFAEAWQIDKVINIDKEYALFELDISARADAKVVYNDIFIKTYQIGSQNKDQNSTYCKSYLRLNTNGPIKFTIQDQNNTYYKSYLRQLS